MRYARFADLADRAVLVIGAGVVAEREIATLLSTGADITVTAPQASLQIEQWASQGRLRWVSRAFLPSDMEGVALVFAATNQPGINREIAAQAKAKKIWVNVADDPQRSDFHVPATCRTGTIGVAISTEGSSPALAAWLRDRAQQALPRNIERLARFCQALRLEIVRHEKSQSADCFRQFFASKAPDVFGGGDEDAAQTETDRIFGAGAFERALKQMMEE